MDRGNIYLVSLDPTAGREQQGTRSVLIVSPLAFNRFTHAPVILPITNGGNFARRAGFALSLAGRERAPPALSVAISRAFSIFRPELAGDWKSVPAAIIDEVLAKLAPLFA